MNTPAKKDSAKAEGTESNTAPVPTQNQESPATDERNAQNAHPVRRPRHDTNANVYGELSVASFANQGARHGPVREPHRLLSDLDEETQERVRMTTALILALCSDSEDSDGEEDGGSGGGDGGSGDITAARHGGNGNPGVASHDDTRAAAPAASAESGNSGGGSEILGDLLGVSRAKKRRNTL